MFNDPGLSDIRHRCRYNPVSPEPFKIRWSLWYFPRFTPRPRLHRPHLRPSGVSAATAAPFAHGALAAHISIFLNIPLKRKCLLNFICHYHGSISQEIRVFNGRSFHFFFPLWRWIRLKQKSCSTFAFWPPVVLSSSEISVWLDKRDGYEVIRLTKCKAVPSSSSNMRLIHCLVNRRMDILDPRHLGC